MLPLIRTLCCRRCKNDHFRDLCRRINDHLRDSTDTGQCENGGGGQFGGGRNMFEALERCITPFGQKNHRRRFPKTTASSLPRSLLRKKTAELLRTRHAPTPQKQVGAMLALPCHVKRSRSLAVIVAQESAKPLVTFDSVIRVRLHILRK